MAIYISGVKGLPEQVQENKENIKAIQEEIEGIDFEEIRELEEQVAENTQDINNLEGSVGVQNIAIADHEERLDALEPKVSALETKTSQISYDEDNDSTNVGASVKIYGNGEIESRQLTALDTHYKDAEISNSESGIYLVQGGLTAVRIFNSHSGSTHTLDFNDDGSLEVDGQPIGKKFYNHIIYMNRVITGYLFVLKINLITEDSTPFTKDTLKQFLTTKGYTSYNKFINANGALYSGGNDAIITSIWVERSSIRFGYYSFYAHNEQSNSIASADLNTLTDNVIEV